MPLNPREFFRQFDRTQVRVSPQAQRLIYVIIESVYEDPHPRWKVESYSVFEPMALRIANSVPKFLNEMINTDDQLKKGITTFDILHWLSSTTNGKSNLDRLCPFEK